MDVHREHVGGGVGGAGVDSVVSHDVLHQDAPPGVARIDKVPLVDLELGRGRIEQGSVHLAIVEVPGEPFEEAPDQGHSGSDNAEDDVVGKPDGGGVVLLTLKGSPDLSPGSRFLPGEDGVVGTMAEIGVVHAAGGNEGGVDSHIVEVISSVSGRHDSLNVGSGLDDGPLEEPARQRIAVEEREHQDVNRVDAALALVDSPGFRAEEVWEEVAGRLKTNGEVEGTVGEVKSTRPVGKVVEEEAEDLAILARLVNPELDGIEGVLATVANGVVAVADGGFLAELIEAADAECNTLC